MTPRRRSSPPLMMRAASSSGIAPGCQDFAAADAEFFEGKSAEKGVFTMVRADIGVFT